MSGDAAVWEGSELLASAGLPSDAVTAWSKAWPERLTSYAVDRNRYSGFWLLSARLIEQLPLAAHRSAREQAAAKAILETARDSRKRFLRQHVEALYDALTDGRRRHVRVEELVLAAADVVPGLAPSRQELAA